MFEVITGTNKCPYCDKAKALLKSKGMQFRESVLDTQAKKTSFIEAGFRTVPQIYLNNELIGGYDELVKYLESYAK